MTLAGDQVSWGQLHCQGRNVVEVELWVGVAVCGQGTEVDTWGLGVEGVLDQEVEASDG